ncbi:MAG: HAMP domain-containing histidine kinase [Actinomycetota bacterium]|nr:HAMP domain-containing histidine kinase [Actinomycetota bacterium]
MALVVPKRFRRRLTAAFVLVAGVTAGILAVGSYLAVREYRHDTFAEQAGEQASLLALAAPRQLSLEGFEALLSEYQRRAGFETIAVEGEVTFSSSPRFGIDDVPSELLAALPRDETRQAATSVHGDPYLVIADRPSAGDATLYMFFPRRYVDESVREMRNVLAIGWVFSVAAAAAIGQQVARRTLRPVREAAGAAHSMAEGLLHTRLSPASDDEFGAWAQSFNHMAECLEEKITALSRAADRERRFTADVAHELRTPLTGMTSAASLLEENLGDLPDTTRRPAEILIHDARRLEGLVLELLELARFDAGQEGVHLEPLRLADAVSAVLSSWNGDTPVETIVHDGLSVLADRARFKRVLANLVANGLHHGGGSVRVVARPDGPWVAIDVVDTGPGIDDKDLPRVFERFYKRDLSRSGGGSGLGLAIALENARVQGGSIEASNADGGGACFTFRLRAAGAAQGHADSPTS